MDKPWLRENWFSSPLTYEPEVQAGFNFPDKVEILELTLDENGEGMAGAKLSEDQKLTVARIFDEMGVHRIGVLGYPMRMTPEEKTNLADEVKYAKRIRENVKSSKLSALSTTVDDVERAAECGVDEVVIRGFVTHVQDLEPETNEQKVENFLVMARRARELGMRVSMLAQGVTRADLQGDVRDILTAIKREVDLDEVCLTDTHGVGTPEGYGYMVRKVKEWLDIPIQVHCHDHLGLGTANACAAAAAGASVIHTTVHGLGHFSGLAALEEVAVALSVGYGIDMGMDLERLYSLSQEIQKYTGIEMPPHKPVVGHRAFVMANDVFYNELNLERKRVGMPRTSTLPYLPEMVGNAERVFLGEGLSEVAVKWQLSLLDYDASETQVTKIFERACAKIDAGCRQLSEEQFREIADDVIAA